MWVTGNGKSNNKRNEHVVQIWSGSVSGRLGDTAQQGLLHALCFLVMLKGCAYAIIPLRAFLCVWHV